MSGLFGGSQENETRTTIELGPEQRQLFNYAMPFLKQFAKNPPTLPTQSGVAPFNPTQVQAQESAIGSALGGQSQLAQSGLDATKFLLGPALDPNTNPALQGTINAATRPIGEALTQQVLPNIRSEFRGVGQYGGSRQGIAEGLAATGALNAIGDASSRVANEGYQSGLDAFGKGLALLPQTSAQQIAPAQTLGAVGDVRQGFDQAVLTEMLQRYMAEQTLPLSVGQSLVGLVNGLPGGTTVATGSTPQSSPIASALGGASIGNSIFPGFAGAGIGAGLGALSAFF